MPGTKAGLPSADVWNPRFLSLSATKKSRKMHKKKLCNMRELLRRHDLVGVVETHVDPDTAELFFFDKLQRNVAAPGDQTGLAEDQAKVCTVDGRGPKEHPQPTCRPNGAQRLPGLPFGLRWPVVRA